MNSKEDPVRSAIADQATEWLMADADGPLDPQQSAALSAWLAASPAHVEEFLRASVIARDLRAARSAPEYSVAAVLARARAEDDASSVTSFRPRALERPPGGSPGRWRAAVAMAAVVVLGLGLTFWRLRPPAPAPVAAAVPVVHYQTGHGEQLTQRLADNSVLHLDTDSAVAVSFSAQERLVTLTAGQAAFEVAHEPARQFRVVGGPAEVIAVGTRFDVRLKDAATVVTVVEGRVDVGLAAKDASGAPVPPRYVRVSADQQIRVSGADWPGAPVAIDAQHTTAWLHREIVFDHEPLERVAAEFNRYAPKPIRITTPAAGKLEISGAFATDDTDAFIAFLRTLKGLRVQVTATDIQVSQP